MTQISNLLHDIHIKLRNLQQKSIKGNNVTYLSNICHITDCYTTAATCGAGTAYPFGTLPVFSGFRVTRSLVLCVCFVDRCFSFCTLSCGHCVVCSSSIYGFWLLLWYFQTLLTTSFSKLYIFLTTFHFPVAVEALMVHNKSVRSTQMTSGLSNN
jgi:hypothetical protein